MYYRGAQAAIVVYDVTNTDTFGRAKAWVKELQVGETFWKRTCIPPLPLSPGPPVRR